MRILLISILIFLCHFAYCQDLNSKSHKCLDEGNALYKEGKYKSALSQFIAAKELVPTDTVAYSYISDCAYKTNEPDVVYQILKQAKVIGYQSYQLYANAISAARDLERNYTSAIDLANQALIEFPDHPALLFEKSMVYYESGNYQENSQQLSDLIVKYPNYEKAYYQLFHNLLEKEGKNEEALALLKTAIKQFTNNDDFKKLEPDVYLKVGDIAQAEIVLNSLIKQYPSDPKLFYNLALVYYHKDEFEKSVEMSNRALMIDPNYYEAIYNLGSFFYYMGLQNNMALNEMDVLQYVYNNQGRNFEKAARQYFELAKPYFERALKIKPDELDAYENLNTINVLLENLNNMLNEEIPQTQMIQPEGVVKSERPLLFINNMAFHYPDEDGILKKGEKGTIKFNVSNRGNLAGANLKLIIIQPVVIQGLLFNKETTISNVNPGEDIQVDIPVSFDDNDANIKGIEKIAYGTKKLRLFIQEPNGYNADLVEFEIILGDTPQFDEKVVVAKTSDIKFIPNPKPRNFLLLLAVDDYKNWPDLQNPIKDTKSLKSCLIDKYQFDEHNIFELYNSDFTHENLRNELIKIKNEITPIDNLIIYYAGHGSYDNEFDQGAWISYDAALGKESDYIQNSSLLRYLEGIQSKHMLLLVDACFSGALFQGGKVVFTDTPDEKLNSRWAFSAGNIELVSDGTAGGHSPFAQSLLEVLTENKSNALALRDLISYVSFKVKNQTEQTPVGKPLNLKQHQGGEFIFHLKN